MSQMDRVELCRILGKAVAYKDCGKPELANQYARQLIARMADLGIILPNR